MTVSKYGGGESGGTGKGKGPDYPIINWQNFKIPEGWPFKEKLKLTPNNLLLRNDLEYHEYTRLRGWGEWRGKGCRECGNRWKLVYVIVPTGQMQEAITYKNGMIDLAWEYSKVVFTGAYPTCGCSCNKRPTYDYIQKQLRGDRDESSTDYNHRAGGRDLGDAIGEFEDSTPF